MHTTSACPDVPLPAGTVDIRGWEDTADAAWRVVRGAVRSVEGCKVSVSACAVQNSDGSIDRGDDAPRVSVWNPEDAGLSADQARELASQLVAAADELDGLYGW
jgi:hypothetical protein